MHTLQMNNWRVWFKMFVFQIGHLRHGHVVRSNACSSADNKASYKANFRAFYVPVFILFYVLFNPSLSQAQEQAQQNEQNMKKSAQTGQAFSVLVMGDSLSAAYGIDAKDGWVALLDESYASLKVINASLSLIHI